MGLFKSEEVTLHSGAKSNWIIDCDWLTDYDYDTLAAMAAKIIPRFGSVEGIPRGGLRLAEALKKYVTEGPVLICDDVLTSGASMEQHRAGRQAFGVVIFARNIEPAWWIIPLFSTRVPA